MTDMRKILEAVRAAQQYSPEEFRDALKGDPVIAAYNEKTRNLNMHGDKLSTIDSWRRVMKLALQGSSGTYNNFDVGTVASGLQVAIDDLGIESFALLPGRESSVVLYVHASSDDLEDLSDYIKDYPAQFANVDENDVFPDGYKDIPGPVLRLWWD